MVELEVSPLVRRGFVVQNRAAPCSGESQEQVVSQVGGCACTCSRPSRCGPHESRWVAEMSAARAIGSDWPGAQVVVDRPWCRNRRPLALGR
jgi:hypothetical protein